MEIIKERERVTETSYDLNFYLKETGEISFSFPCDSEGHVDESKLLECAILNLRECLAKTDVYYSRAKKHVNSYTEPAVGKCSCGEEFELINDYMGATECPKCGRWYNLFGQELLPPDQWEADYYDY